MKIGDKVTTRAGYKIKNQAIRDYLSLKDDYEKDRAGNIKYKQP